MGVYLMRVCAIPGKIAVCVKRTMCLLNTQPNVYYDTLLIEPGTLAMVMRRVRLMSCDGTYPGIMLLMSDGVIIYDVLPLFSFLMNASWMRTC